MIRLPKSPRKIPLARQAVRNSCSVIILLTFLSAFYRRYWLDAHDPYKCNALLSRGHWLDPPIEPYLTRPFQKWQPPGCMLHEYTGKDIQSCMSGQRIVYIGDSATRQLFWASAKKLNMTVADEEMREAGKHEDLTFEEGDVMVDFIWDPFLNSSSLRGDLLSYLNDGLQGNADTVGKAGLVIVGGGLWFARNFGSDWLDQFKDSIDYLVPLLGLRRGAAATLYSPPGIRRQGKGHHVYVTPVQIPLYDVLSPVRAASMTPAKINPMNEYLYNASKTKGVKVVWSHSLMTWESEYAYEESGLHVIENVSSRRVDVLLNMRCNAELSLSQGYPFDKTCCSAYERERALGMRSLPLLIFTAPVIIGLWIHNWRQIRAVLCHELSQAFGIFALTLLYCFVADRTQLFNKGQKHFAHQEFLTMCAIVFALGVFSIRRSPVASSPCRFLSVKDRFADQPFLSRDQTDEWKGWMQFVILIYHYTGASSILWIYQLIRVLVASYLFMTGFGHTVFFLRKQDYSFKRSASILVRLNVLSCLLPYVMETDYLFYYFAPLVSFWYMVVYLTMRISHSRNVSLSFLLGKIVISAAIVTISIRCSTVFEKTFLLFKYTCGITWNVKEWRFRLQLDGYIVYVGMLAAILNIKVSEMLNAQRFPPQDRVGFVRRHWTKIHVFSVLLALTVLPSFWIFSRSFTDKFVYNTWVPYVSLFPIVSFTILRNSNHYFRKYYSSVFAWLGRCSLETFTLQFHIWLAADTKGLLSLGVFGREPTHTDGRHQDLIILTVVFLYLSWLTADATVLITKWVVDPKGAKGSLIAESVAKSEGKDRSDEFNMDRSKIGRHLISLYRRAANHLYTLWTEKLEVRLLSILLSMWILNMLNV
ncbi:MAG: hypothetical protein LQ343_002585 [Gyalolechia ehrenbergii]|nr:MAG: hypothetical protein LQ343_002585 [Gyalolechia ehrenbergii]